MTTGSASGEERVLGREPSRARWARRVWPIVPVIAALLAFPGCLSTTRVYFVRDLAFGFWPLHLWLKHTIASGDSLLWDPYLGMGAATIVDPNRQLLFLPTLLVRLLTPDVLGFNLLVALAFPVAAVGTFLLVRRHASAPASALGASFFAVSGPVLSSANFPNVSWSLSLLPWIVWAAGRFVGRPHAGHFALLTSLLALQLTAGEPVTAAASLATAVAFVACESLGENWKDAAGRTAAAVGAAIAAALLAGVYVLPLAQAASRSNRTAAADPVSTGAWALHPLTLAESVLPFLFGDPLVGGSNASPWLAPLNGGLLPYLFSIYVGLPVLFLALAGIVTGGTLPPRRRTFWLLLFAVSLLCAFGKHTPLYPALLEIAPILRAFRSPSKYLLLTALPLAVFAAVGWDSLRGSPAARQTAVRGAMGLGASAAVLTLGVLALALAAPEHFASAAGAIGRHVGVSDPSVASAYLAGVLPAQLGRLVALVLGMILLIAVAASHHRFAPACRWVLFAAAVLDPLAVNMRLNPQTEAAALGQPEWVALARRDDAERVYVAGRVSQFAGAEDDWRAVHGPSLSGYTDAETSARGAAALATVTSPWRLRDSISFDANAIRPREYSALLVGFAQAPLDRRRAFLARAGVRFHLTSVPPGPASVPVWTSTAYTPLALYEGARPWPRARVATAGVVEPDTSRQIDRMLALEGDTSSVVLAGDPPPAAGAGGAGGAPSAAIVEDGASLVVVTAVAPDGGGFLVLADTFEPDWEVSVDGVAAPLLRADAVFRAVRITSGSHTVIFEYRPRSLYAGAGLSAITALLLSGGVICWRRRRVRRTGPE